MPYNNPISNELPRPDVGLDMVLNSLVRDFKDISWLDERVFHRAYEFRHDTTEGKLQIEPQVYMGGGEYYPVLFNDNLPNSLFFRADGNEAVAFDRGVNARLIPYSRQLSLIFWGNLKRISASYAGDYIFTESIKTEFMTVLAKNQYVRTINSLIDDPLNQIFEGYTIDDEKIHLAKYPYAALRINFTVEYKTGVVPC